MGSMNFYPLSKNVPTKEQRPGIQAEEKIDISRLTNSIYYFIECVYIVRLKQSYRLVACHKGHILWNQVYQTLHSAKTAFSKLFHYKLWDINKKPDWSDFYPPETQWYEIITPQTPPTQSPGGES